MFTNADQCILKVFAKAVQSLAKFGTELFLECEEQCLQLRSVNQSHSAVGTIKLKRGFFDYYKIRTGEEIYCKLAMKTCLVFFRNMKSVETCVMKICKEETKLQIQFKCNMEKVRTTHISFVDEENISASMTPDNTVNVIIGSYKIFGEISGHFNTVEEELTLEAQKDNVTLKNYIEGTRVNDKFMRSQLRLAPDEFFNYKVDQETVVTFCLKEFKAFLYFAEALNENLILNFDESGSPMFVSMIKENQVECTLIMSTLSPEDVSFSEDYCAKSIVGPEAINTAPQKRKLADATSSSSSKTPRHIANADTLSNDSELFQFNRSNSHDTRPSQPSIVVPRHEEQPTNSNSNSMLIVAVDNSTSTSTSTNMPTHAPPSEDVITFCDTEKVSEDMDVDFVPQSPQRVADSQMRSIFLRCFESTYVPKNPSPSSQLYVPDSDTED